MGTFKIKEDYLKQLCIDHPTVAHTAVVDGVARNSFFRLNNDEEYLAAARSNISYPCVGYYYMKGRLYDNGGGLADIRHVFADAWIFLQHVNMVGTSFTDNIQTCWDETFAIMEDFIKTMKDDYETNGACGAFAELDINSFNYVQVGPVFENEYGWILSFTDQQKATRIL